MVLERLIGKKIVISEEWKADLAQLMFMLPLLILIFSKPYLDLIVGPELARFIFFFGLVGTFALLYVSKYVEQAQFSKYLAFPKCIFRVNETEKAASDIYVTGFRLIRENSYKGRTLYYYYVEFKPPVNIPSIGVVDKAIWVLPCEWEEAFQFTTGLACWGRTQIISHPKAEYAVFYVPKNATLEYMGEPIPVMLLADSSYYLTKRTSERLLHSIDEEIVTRGINSFLIDENVRLRKTLEYLNKHIEGFVKTKADVDTMFLNKLSYLRSIYGELDKIPVTTEKVKRAVKISLPVLIILIIMILVFMGIIKITWGG